MARQPGASTLEQRGPHHGQGQMGGSVSFTECEFLSGRNTCRTLASVARAVRGLLTLLIILKPACRIFLASL